MDDDGLCAQCSHELYLEKMGQIGEMGQAYDNVEVKTERLEPDVDVCSRAAEGSRQPDDIERDDFEEENRLLAHCPELIVNRKLKYSQSGKSSLSSSSETISLNDMPTDYSRPGCSRDLPDDSNSTIKKMIKSKTYPVEKEDFMQKLLNSNIEEKKNFPKGKLYKAEVMEGVIIDSSMCGLHGGGPSGRTSSNASSIGSMGSDSTKEFSVPSTSNADKLLGLDDSGKRSDAGSSKSSNYRQKYCDDDSDDDHEESLCTCSSSHEDDDDEDEADPEPDRHWRKRRYEPPQPQVAKRFCPDGSFDGNLGEQWGAGGSGLQGSASPQGPPEVNQWLNRFTSWTDSEKTRAIDALIGCCAAGQVRHMMKAIEPLFQRDFISLLPKELALTVLAYLQPKDLLRAAQTCRYWRFLADDNLLWKEQCRRIGITTLKARCLTRSLPRCASPWKAAYMRQYLIENNWLQKPVDNPIVMRGHDDHVITCLQFYGNRILSGSDDTTLKVWSAVTGRCLRTLVGHSGGVWSSQMVGHLVISGSTDRTLRVWNARTGQCIKVLAGHTSTVRCMHLHDNRVVSGSRDATLRVWSIPDGRCMRVLVGHIAAVRCVQFDGKYVVSGAYDYFVKIWNPDTGECLHTLSGHTNRVYSLQKLRLSCEPSLFAMEQLLISMAANVHTSRPLQLLIQPVLAATFKQELSDRQRLLEKNIRLMSDEAFEQNLRRGSRQLQQNGECAYCRRHLFLSRVVGVVEGDLCSRHGLALYEQAQARQERLDNATCIKMMPHGADHIKNYVTVAGDMTLAVGPSELAKDIIDKIKRRVSRYYDVIEVAEKEAANCLFVNQTLIHQAIEEIPESFKAGDHIPQVLPASSSEDVSGVLHTVSSCGGQYCDVFASNLHR